MAGGLGVSLSTKASFNDALARATALGIDLAGAISGKRRCPGHEEAKALFMW